MKAKSAAKKIYIQPGKMVYDTLVDMMTLQNGRENINDETAGRLHYSLTMEYLSWTLCYTVFDADSLRCRVTLEIEEELESSEMDESEKMYLETVILNQFALLDSMLLNERFLRVSYDERRCV